MFQTCQHCSYESPAGARFCRQCGAPLIAETEFSAASTRNYGRQEPAVGAAGSGHLSPSVADIVAGETERYYQTPYVPAPIAPSTAPIKRGIKLWRWMIGLLLVLFVGVGIGAIVGMNMRSRRAIPVSSEEFARNQRQEEMRRRLDDQRRDAQNRMRDAENRARDIQNHARDALKRAGESAERAMEAGATLAATDEKPLDLSQYEYPGATQGIAIRIPGREMLVMRVPDGHYDAVNQFFQKKFGKPIIENNEPYPGEKMLVFQSNTAPAVSVSVETDTERPGPMLKIVVLRSPFPIFRPIEDQKSK